VFVGLITGGLVAFNAPNGNLEWQVSTRGALRSRALPAGKVVVFASAEGKVYVSRSDFLQPLIRWSAVGPIVAPMSSYGARTILVGSEDKSLYSVDIFTGLTNWSFPTGAPIDIEPMVGGEDVYVVNKEGFFSRVDVKSGSPYWTISTLGGPLLAVTSKRVYLESRDGDLFIVDRDNGHMIADPRDTHQRAGVNIRNFEFGPTNHVNDRLYMGSKSGMILCLREIDQVRPRPLRDASQKPIGYIPPEGYQDEKPLPPPPNAADTPLDQAPGEPAPTAKPAEKPNQ
jgi:outer membrane protein assembly factor BamB